MNKNRHAFTLIELLVVIAIISILAALLLPIMNSSIETARSVDCMHRQAVIYANMQLYCEDTRYFPPDDAYVSSAPANLWTEVLGYQYLNYPSFSNTWGGGRYGVFKCPSSPETWSGMGSDVGADYGISPYLYKESSPPNEYYYSWSEEKPKKRTEIQEAVIAFVDLHGKNAYQDGCIDRPFWADRRHQGKANWMFTDGHTESTSDIYGWWEMDGATGYYYNWHWRICKKKPEQRHPWMEYRYFR